MKLIEKVLSFNDILTNNYILDNINLARSIVIKNDNEAKLYNDYIERKYSHFNINKENKATWRYYKHLNCEYHELDTEIYFTSIDNGLNVLLTKNNILLHPRTHKELLKFGFYYNKLISQYPEQELFIKSVITSNIYNNINDIINLPDFTIVSYNDKLIEENESDLISELQYYLDNYKVTRLIPYYQLSDELFIVSQYHILYFYLFTKLLALRLKNAKTIRAHSYHIRNYLASYHRLSKYYSYLSKSQLLFLYRNLLYINNHVGKNKIFKILIDKLFTERNVTVLNYVYRQLHDIDNTHTPKYVFKQKVLNSNNLTYINKDFTIESIKEKEYNLFPGNKKEYDYNFDKISNMFKYSLSNYLFTKDLEMTVVENTDNVKYKLIPIIVDYWAYLLKTNRISFSVDVLDPVSNIVITLNTKDLFKLFVYVLNKANGIDITTFPEYRIKRVFRENLPSNSTLLLGNYRNYLFYNDLIDKIKSAIPSYTLISNSFSFYDFIFKIYLLNIGLWILVSNFSNKDNEGQISRMIDNLHFTDVYEYNDETVEQFLGRAGVSHLYFYNSKDIEPILFNILNSIFEERLNFLNKYKYIQKALVEVFRNFNSYTIQIIDSYQGNSITLTGQKDDRYSLIFSKLLEVFFYDIYNINIEGYTKLRLIYKFSHNDGAQCNFRFRIPIILSLGRYIVVIIPNFRGVHGRIVGKIDLWTDYANVIGFTSFALLKLMYKLILKESIQCNFRLSVFLHVLLEGSNVIRIPNVGSIGTRNVRHIDFWLEHSNAMGVTSIALLKSVYKFIHSESIYCSFMFRTHTNVPLEGSNVVNIPNAGGISARNVRNIDFWLEHSNAMGVTSIALLKSVYKFNNVESVRYNFILTTRAHVSSGEYITVRIPNVRDINTRNVKRVDLYNNYSSVIGFTSSAAPAVDNDTMLFLAMNN